MSETTHHNDWHYLPTLLYQSSGTQFPSHGMGLTQAKEIFTCQVNRSTNHSGNQTRTFEMKVKNDDHYTTTPTKINKKEYKVYAVIKPALSQYTVQGLQNARGLQNASDEDRSIEIFQFLLSDSFLF